MKQLIYILPITAILLSACKGRSEEQNEQVNADTVMHQHDMEMGSGIAHQMDGSPMTVQESQMTSQVLDAYLNIKNALVADNDKEAALAGKDLVNAFDHFDKSAVPATKMAELKDIIADARENADHISENQGNIEHQREHFELLGTDIKDLVAIAGADRTLYQIYCPMYNHNEGGSWLSASDAIQNPFYGSKMSDCGEVRSVIAIK
ncbi:MAG: DUF3347 domain-containing protein [Bacteroidales bacterium]